jgi:hypothetical protein
MEWMNNNRRVSEVSMSQFDDCGNRGEKWAHWPRTVPVAGRAVAAGTSRLVEPEPAGRRDIQGM